MSNTATAFGCVTDTNGPYLEHSARLLLSLRWFGGRHANSPFILCVVGDLSDNQFRFFYRHGAQVYRAKHFDHRHGPSNKLRFFQNSKLDQYDYLVLLDCDTIVVQDPSQWVVTDGFSAKPADQLTVSREALSIYLESHSIIVPDASYFHDIADRPGLPYFNSGVIVLHRKWRVQLYRAWSFYNRDLLERAQSFQINPYHVDQVSLTAALLSAGIPIGELPTEMNFPAHFPAPMYPDRIWTKDPVIIHYHGLFDHHGYIGELEAPRAHLRAKSFNARLHAERGSLMSIKPYMPKERRGKVVVGTGWWSTQERSQWSIGADEIRSTSFFNLWYRQVMACIQPKEIYVTDSCSPIKPIWADYPNIHWVELDNNYGHPNDVRTGKIKARGFSGYTRSLLAGAMYAYCCDADYYVYVEQDCLLRGIDFLEHAIGDNSNDILLGARTENGVGIEGRSAAPMFQTSLLIVARKGLERFISGILSSPHGDGEISIEVILERQCAPFGILSVPYGRSRPIDYHRSHFYAQNMSDQELKQFMNTESFPAIRSVFML